MTVRVTPNGTVVRSMSPARDVWRLRHAPRVVFSGELACLRNSADGVVWIDIPLIRSLYVQALQHQAGEGRIDEAAREAITEELRLVPPDVVVPAPRKEALVAAVALLLALGLILLQRVCS